MRRIAVTVSLIMLLFRVSIAAQTPAPKPGPEQEKLGVLEGEWSIEAQAKDSPSGTEYKRSWTLQDRRILGGFFFEVHHTWKSQGTETTGLEILRYDPSKQHYTSCGFGSDGGSWTATATFKDRIFVISGTSLNVEGKPTGKWRFTWAHSADWMSVSVKGEQEKDGTWWTSLTGKGVKTKAAPKGE